MLRLTAFVAFLAFVAFVAFVAPTGSQAMAALSAAMQALKVLRLCCNATVRAERGKNRPTALLSNKFRSCGDAPYFPAEPAGHEKPGSPGPGAGSGAPPNSRLRGLVVNVPAARSTERIAERTSSVSESTRGSVS